MYANIFQFTGRRKSYSRNQTVAGVEVVFLLFRFWWAWWGRGSLGVVLFILFYLGVRLEFILSNFWILFGALIAFSVILGFVFASLRYSKQFYWITNKRVIYKRGLIGYRITSIPYERISDVVISHTFWERLFGFGSLHIQSLAGQVSGTHTLGSEGVLLAISNPEEIQELIFKLVKSKRKEERLTF